MSIEIQLATTENLLQIKTIADKERGLLGFVTRPALQESVERSQLYVAVAIGGEVVGFANCWRRKDGWHTIREICITFSYRANGAGRALINAIPKPIRLKCLADNDQANQFYQHLGFVLAKTIPANGKKRALYEWHLTQ